MPEPTLESLCQQILDLKEDNKEEHKAILAQTTKTNGCVASIQEWRYTLKGELNVIKTLLLAIIIPVALFFFYKFVS